MNLFEAMLILESSCCLRSPTCFSVLNSQVMDREITYVVADDSGVLNEAYVRNLTFTGTSTCELIRRLKKEIGTEDIYVCARNCHTRLSMPLDEELPPLYEVHNYLEVFMAVFPREFLRLLSSVSWCRKSFPSIDSCLQTD